MSQNLVLVFSWGLRKGSGTIHTYKLGNRMLPCRRKKYFDRSSMFLLLDSLHLKSKAWEPSGLKLVCCLQLEERMMWIPLDLNIGVHYFKVGLEDLNSEGSCQSVIMDHELFPMIAVAWMGIEQNAVLKAAAEKQCWCSVVPRDSDSAFWITSKSLGEAADFDQMTLWQFDYRHSLVVAGLCLHVVSSRHLLLDNYWLTVYYLNAYLWNPNYSSQRIKNDSCSYQWSRSFQVMITNYLHWQFRHQIHDYWVNQMW